MQVGLLSLFSWEKRLKIQYSRMKRQVVLAGTWDLRLAA